MDTPSPSHAGAAIVPLDGSSLVATPASPGSPGSSGAAAYSECASFQCLLGDAAGRQALLRFLEARYSEQHLLFWQRVQFEYMPLAAATPEDTAAAEARDALAKELWGAFVRPGIRSPLNLTEVQRMKLQQVIVEKVGKKDKSGCVQHAPADLFAESAAHCVELLRGNYFHAFQQSRDWERYQKDKQNNAKDKTAEGTASQRERAHQKSGSTTCIIL